ncbi:predicted protein [Histoplasma capsulatum H143]|uniref:Uncharacterized protein n=1 Tax=Ajellomyces capsulatus (strain H143) TaxID=544712 RepID=C6HEB8_AJECH|nr:predicted protein [Histoplasma capsulatum H143]
MCFFDLLKFVQSRSLANSTANLRSTTWLLLSRTPNGTISSNHPYDGESGPESCPKRKETHQHKLHFLLEAMIVVPDAADMTITPAYGKKFSVWQNPGEYSKGFVPVTVVVKLKGTRAASFASFASSASSAPPPIYSIQKPPQDVTQTLKQQGWHQRKDKIHLAKDAEFAVECYHLLIFRHWTDFSEQPTDHILRGIQQLEIRLITLKYIISPSGEGQSEEFQANSSTEWREKELSWSITCHVGVMVAHHFMINVQKRETARGVMVRSALCSAVFGSLRPATAAGVFSLVTSSQMTETERYMPPSFQVYLGSVYFLN